MQPAPDEDPGTGDLQLAFTASPVAIRESLRQMMAAVPFRDLTQDQRSTAELILAEVLNNVAEHAYDNRPGPVTVTISPTRQGLHCTVVDQGRAMPDDGVPAGRLPDVKGTAHKDLPEGGFGWHLIRSLTTGLRYARVNGCNRLEFFLP